MKPSIRQVSRLLLGCVLAGCSTRAAEPAYARFSELPITAITPRGWLRGYLEAQRDGLTGHLEAAGYPFNTIGWAGPAIPNNTSIEDWWPYEQNAYWVDGMERCGLLLRDDFLQRKAGRQIDYVLSHPAPNGYLGPLFGGPSSEVNRWIHVVFFRALMAAYADGHHDQIPGLLRRHYLAGDASYAGVRDSVNIEAMLWTYAHTGDPALLALAEKTYALAEARNSTSATAAVHFLEDRPAYEHGVTYDERAKLGAMLYLYTGKPAYLAPSVAAFRKIDRYHRLVSGVNVSSEYLQPVTTTEACENCDISDYTWSAGYLLMATGDAGYADRIERAVFNAAPGSVTGDFKALQYFSAPNQVACTQTSFPRSAGAQMSFAPNPGTECCPGNVNRCMPNFAARLWLRGEAGALAAVMYAPSSVQTTLGSPATAITIVEETDYPFGDTITFRFRPARPVSFPIELRIPGWAENASVSLNGARLALACPAGSFVRVQRRFRDGDVVTLTLPQRVELEPGPSNTVSVVRGPLVYSLALDERWSRVPAPGRSTAEFPAYDLTTTATWNYALLAPADQPVVTVERPRPVGAHPWTIATAPVILRARARRLTNWRMVSKKEVTTEHWSVERDPKTNQVRRWYVSGEDHHTGDFQFMPDVPPAATVASHLAGPVESIVLVPYGCAKLRITYFPVASLPP